MPTEVSGTVAITALGSHPRIKGALVLQQHSAAITNRRTKIGRLYDDIMAMKCFGLESGRKQMQLKLCVDVVIIIGKQFGK